MKTTKELADNLRAKVELLGINGFNIKDDLSVVLTGESEIVNIPEGVLKIDGQATRSARLILDTLEKNKEYITRYIKIPKSVKRLEEYVFAENEWLREVVIPIEIKTIPDYSFLKCKGIRKVNLEHVEKICNGAFKCCYELNYVDLDSILEIDKAAFMDCISLSSLSISDSIKSIGETAFSNCYKLTNVDISKCNEISRINGWSFMNCNGLREIKLGPNVNEICTSAFMGCTNLTKINLERVEHIEKDAFMWCESLLKQDWFQKYIEKFKLIGHTEE